MVAFGLVAVFLAAVAQVSECRAHGHYIHQRRFNNITSLAIGTGGADLDAAATTMVSPTAETKTLTYTLGDGRAITTTVVKTIASASVPETTLQVTSESAPESTAAEDSTSTLTERATRTSTTTVIVTLPAIQTNAVVGASPSAAQSSSDVRIDAVASADSSSADACLIKTVYVPTTAVTTVVVTSTLPAAQSAALTPPAQIAPYSNTTLVSAVMSDSTITSFTTLTTSIPLSTGTAY